MAPALLPTEPAPRHTPFVRVTHWLTFLSFLALLLTGVDIVISHPRFYWGEQGNVNTPALFVLPIPDSRVSVNTGYPWLVNAFGGHQSARTLHFTAIVLLVLFVFAHVVMVWRAGCKQRISAMITGGQPE